ncbi:DUF2931 family protein [Pseudomonas sp. PS02290]|uniref:DUF2931 family protein n=1 Tax=Pseudomonas sp. PS02290 TaxID=2991430 RepID=UPI00249CC6A6|nr:DUF2931 family protein [Pseudomonas sp. PS02290]
MRRLVFAAVLLISLSACAKGGSVPPPVKLPYPAWYVGFAAPRHMEVWVEGVDVLDQRGYVFFNVHAGVAGYTRKPEGWHKGTSGGKPINNVDLPEQILLRWQSLVEPQAYKISIRIPQWVRDEMVTPQRVYCRSSKESIDDYRFAITLGMAPGGIVKVWVGGPCLGFKEVGRFQAQVEPRGPYMNDKGLYYRAPNPAAQAWIDQNGIPYGSW